MAMISNNSQWGRAHSIYQQLESLLSILSDLHKQILAGDLDSLHQPDYLFRLMIAHAPNLCSSRKNCSHECYDKTLSECGFEISEEKYKNCEKIRTILVKNKIWKLFPELIEKYKDDETYGQGCVGWEQQAITHLYDSLANLTVAILFFFYEKIRKNITLNPYLDFCQKLRKHQGHIINLNYDLLFEDARKQCNISSFKIYKPHGSFDLGYYTKKPYSHWNVQAIQQDVYRFVDEKNIFEFHNRHYSAFLEPLCIAYSDIHTHQAISQTKQALFVKEYTIPMLQQLKTKVASFDKVVSVGYSFSSDSGKHLIDQHIIELFKGKALYIVGKGSTLDIAKRVKECISDIHVYATFFDGFSDYVKRMK